MRNIKILIISLVCVDTFANSYQNNCMQCHYNSMQMQMFMSRYTLRYSSEKSVKSAIYKYLKNPDMNSSVMPVGFLNNWGVKEATTLSDKELKEAIDVYYKEYNLKRVFK